MQELSEKYEKCGKTLRDGKLFMKYGRKDLFGPKKRRLIFSDDLNDFCWVG